MKKLSSTLPHMILSLGLITILSGVLLGGMYVLTEEPIARQNAEQRISAIRELAPPFTNDPEKDACNVNVDGQEFRVYPAIKDGALQGAAVQGSTMQGFGGEIQVMVGFNKKGDILDYRVMKHAETPGLGSRMEAWFRDPTGARSIIGFNPGSSPLAVTKDGGKVDGITAATISSRAFLSAVSNAYKAYWRTYGPKPAPSRAEAEAKADSVAPDASSGASRREPRRTYFFRSHNDIGKNRPR